MSKEVIELESKPPTFAKTGLTYFDVDLLFRKPPVKETIFDLNELNGGYQEYPEWGRLVGHLKRWNMAVSRGERTSEKEVDLFNHLYSMLKCIKYEQTAVQRGNLRKLEDWFLKHFQRHKTIDYQIKHQNLDLEDKNRLFRSREAHEQLKHYIKPYHICLKLFEYEKEQRKTKQEKENESIERCVRRRNKGEISKLMEDREEREMLRTVEEFSQNRAKRRMINEKISLRKRVEKDKENEGDCSDIYFAKQSRSLHTAGGLNGRYNDELKNEFASDFRVGEFKILEFIKRASKTGFTQSNAEHRNESRQSAKTVAPPVLTKTQKAKSIKKKGARSFYKRPEVTSSAGYRLLVNPFFQKQSKKKRKIM